MSRLPFDVIERGRMKITNTGRRSFIVAKESVITGGEIGMDKKSVYINPGDTVEVTEECGEALSGYNDIRVLEKGKKGKK